MIFNQSRIYVFGGGHAQRARFNDTIQIAFDDSGKKSGSTVSVAKVVLRENSPVPSARTYHASCLLGKYMIIVGGEANSDLRDVWALDLEERVWLKPEITFCDTYTPKRFHSVSAIDDHRIVTFGGCHSEYVHLNEMHVFDLADFLAAPADPGVRVACKRLVCSQGPSTRWGHAAATYNGKLFIVGGRNEQDVIDVHEFDPHLLRWRELEVSGPLPKPRRRHSAVFVSGALVLFGGFDGSFYNDLQILDFQSAKKQVIRIQPTSISQDYKSLVNSEENSDLCFVLDSSKSREVVLGHKPLVLFRLLHREFQTDPAEEAKVADLVKGPAASEFVKKVYNAKPGEEVAVTGVHCKSSFLRFLEFLYCDRFVDPITTAQVRSVGDICKALGLPQSHLVLKKSADLARSKIQHQLTKEMNSQLQQSAAPRLNQQAVKQRVD